MAAEERIRLRDQRKEDEAPEKEQRERRKEREDVFEEAVDRTLEDYDYLVSRQYVKDGDLYEIISTYWDTVRDKFKTRAVKISNPGEDIEHEEDDVIYEEPVLDEIGRKGAVTLVKEHMDASWAGDENTKWPSSEDEWMEAQVEDKYVQVLLEKLQSKEHKVFLSDAPEDEDYFYREETEDGGLGPVKRHFVEHNEYKSHETEVSYRRHREQMVVPRSLVRKCIYYHHEGLMHPGRAKTLAAAQERYYWPTMRRDCANYMAQCTYCLRRKHYNNRAKVPVQAYIRPNRPFYRMHMDVTGPFNTTADGNKYILVFKCALTKWVEIFAIPHQNAEEVAKCLMDEVIMRHGCPHEIVTDRGTEFKNRLLKEVVQVLNIPRHIKTTAYNPRSDGLVETHMRTLKDQLAAHVNKFQTDWDDYLAIAAEYIA